MKNQCDVRQLRARDAVAFLDLRKEAFSSCKAAFGSSLIEEFDVSVESVKRKLRNGANQAPIIGAFTRTGKLVGVVGLSRATGLRFRHKATMWGLFVKEEWRKDGVGRLLVHEAITYAKEMRGVQALKLSVNAEQTPAVRLYYSMGFRLIGIERHALKVGDKVFDGLHMELEWRIPATHV